MLTMKHAHAFVRIFQRTIFVKTAKARSRALPRAPITKVHNSVGIRGRITDGHTYKIGLLP
jgi:hypothetical protein